MTIKELEKIKEAYIDERKREIEEGVATVDVHMGTCGIAAGARGVFAALQEEIERLGVSNVKLRVTGCAGLCSMEPMITVHLPGQTPVKYGKLDDSRTREVFYSHILGGHPKAEYAIGQGLERPQKRVGIE
jgi:NADP-reducing hydrogenase subunit HndB